MLAEGNRIDLRQGPEFPAMTEQELSGGVIRPGRRRARAAFYSRQTTPTANQVLQGLVRPLSAVLKLVTTGLFPDGSSWPG